jgi:hypothetical protein
MENGELEVSGSNQVEIVLKRRPHHISVYFLDNQCPSVPCNPGNCDELEFFLRKVETVGWFGCIKTSYLLCIVWSVSSPRTIIWHARSR